MGKKIFFSLCLVIFVDSISAGIIFPIMPELFLDTQYGLVRSHSFISSSMLYGLSFGLFPLASFFGMPFLGTLSDHYGRRRILILGLSGVCFSDLLACASILLRDPCIFLLSRFIIGFFSATYVVANAVIADLSLDIKSKMNNFKWPTLAFVAGFVLGPLIGGSSSILQGANSLTLPFLVVLCLSLFNLILIYVLFTDIKSIDQKKHKAFRNQFRDIIDIFIDKSLRLLTISYSLFQFAIGLFIQSISLFLADTFNFNTKNIGIFFTVMCMGLALNILFIQPLLSKYIKINKLIISSIIIMSVMLLIEGISVYVDDFIQIDVRLVIWIASLIFYISMPFATTGYTAVYSDFSDKERQGKTMGGLGQISSLMWFLASFFIGYLVLTHESLILMLAGSLALIGALILYMAFFKLTKIDSN
ncbi:MFS transporter [Francisella uliginis]|uniref:Major facilitator superfamily (MFS) profile domain-containing protein n=1 Tax=Francisella uliginis TaxID=573570 RepID=A0A1L4BS44_9GAMM|nr:MFS transporter [Francisella uliginis]API86657.1 hypothetical protein F7310_04455 [Francisella uliginis]